MTATERLKVFREALDNAEYAYRMCDMIDSTARRDRERSALMPRIRALKERVREYERITDLFA